LVDVFCPWFSAVSAQQRIKMTIQFQLVFFQILKQSFSAQHFGNFNQLIVIVQAAAKKMNKQQFKK
jgi:hypothetical protein